MTALVHLLHLPRVVWGIGGSPQPHGRGTDAGGTGTLGP